MKNKYSVTLFSCMLGGFIQSINACILAVLFIPLRNLYGLSYTEFGFLVGLNFIIQFIADIIFSGLIDKYGFRIFIVPAGILSTIGLIFLAFSHIIFGSEKLFYGLILATVVFSFSGGLLEIIVSPIVSAISHEQGGGNMSIVHSVYAFGSVAVVALTTLFLHIFGVEFWYILVLVWAIFPFVGFLLYIKVPMPKCISEESRISGKKLMLSPYFIMCMIAIFFGAGSEIVMNQWTSAFMENGLGLPKVYGDLIGLCGFSLFLGIGRILHGKFGEKFNLNKLLIITSFCSIICYVNVALLPSVFSVIFCVFCGIAVSILWPGTLVVASNKFPQAGALLFAVLAVAGDLGGGIAEYATGAIIDGVANYGLVSNMASWLGITMEQASIRFGIAVSSLYPLLCCIVHCLLFKMHKKESLLNGNSIS